MEEFDKELLNSVKINVKTLEELYKKEIYITNVKMILLFQKPIKGKFDYTHLKNIHKFIFEDIYIWAGLDRYEANIKAKFGKGNTLFTPYQFLPSVAKKLFDALKEEDYFREQSQDNIVISLATFMNGLNILHPFREGNGRVQRVFMELLAKNTGYELDFKNISQKEMDLASAKGANGDLNFMINIFKQSIKAL